jgi:hypothetical protein
MGKERGSDSIFDLLAAVSRGKATITVEGHPFIHLDADEKTLEVDANTFTAAGLRLQDLGGRGGPLATLTGPVHVANALSDQGWKLTLCAEGEKVLTMGKGVSRLTGRIRMNPIKARKLLKALR